MRFSRTEHLLSVLSGSETLFIEDILGLFTDDLYEDVKKPEDENAVNYKNGYEKLPIQDEDKFINNMVALLNSLGRIYRNNEQLFSEDSSKRRWDRAEKRCAELLENQETLNHEVQALQKKMKEGERLQKQYEDELAKKKDLEILLEEKNRLNRELSDKKTICEQTEKQIEELSKNMIPQAQKKLENVTVSCKQAKAVHDELLSKITEATRIKAERQTQLQDKQNELASLKTGIHKNEAELHKCREQCEGQRIELSKMNDEIHRLFIEEEELRDYLIPAAQTELNQARKNHFDIQKKYDDLMAVLDNVNIENSALERETRLQSERLSDKMHDKDQLIRERDALRRDIEKCDNSRQKIENEIEEIQLKKKQVYVDIEELQSEQEECNGKLQKEQETYKKKLQEKQEEYARVMKSINAQRSGLGYQELRTTLILKDFKEQQKVYQKEQAWISEKIHTLLGDETLEVSGDLNKKMSLSPLRQGIQKYNNDMNQKLRDEMSKLEYLLVELEK